MSARSFIIYGCPFLESSRVIQPHITITAVHPHKHYKSYSYFTNNVSTRPFRQTHRNLGTKNSSDESFSRARRTVLFSDLLGLGPQKYSAPKFRELRQRVHQAGSTDHVTCWISYSGTKFILNEPYHVSPDYHQRLAKQFLVARELPLALSPYCGLWDPTLGATPGTRSFLICDTLNSAELDLIVGTAETLATDLPSWNSLGGIVYV